MAAWIKMPLGTEVGLGPGDFVLDYRLQKISPQCTETHLFSSKIEKKIWGGAQPLLRRLPTAHLPRRQRRLWRLDPMALNLGAFGTSAVPRPPNFAPPPFPYTFRRICTQRKSHRAKVPGNETARERKGQGAKAPGSESPRVLLADSLRGAMARERKGSVPY